MKLDEKVKHFLNLMDERDYDGIKDLLKDKRQWYLANEKENSTFFYKAIDLKDLELLKLLCQDERFHFTHYYGDEDDYTFFKMAIDSGSLEIVDYLLQNEKISEKGYIQIFKRCIYCVTCSIEIKRLVFNNNQLHNVLNVKFIIDMLSTAFDKYKQYFDNNNIRYSDTERVEQHWNELTEIFKMLTEMPVFDISEFDDIDRENLNTLIFKPIYLMMYNLNNYPVDVDLVPLVGVLLKAERGGTGFLSKPVIDPIISDRNLSEGDMIDTVKQVYDVVNEDPSKTEAVKDLFEF